MSKDQERIQFLYREIAPRLTNHLVASGQGYAAACDVVQETFLRIWKMRDQLRNDDAQVSGLAFTIAKNLVREHFRKDSRLTLQAEITDGEVSPNLIANSGFEREQGYLYPHDFPNHYVKQQYLPDKIKNKKYRFISI